MKAINAEQYDITMFGEVFGNGMHSYEFATAFEIRHNDFMDTIKKLKADNPAVFKELGIRFETISNKQGTVMKAAKLSGKALAFFGGRMKGRKGEQVMLNILKSLESAAKALQEREKVKIANTVVNDAICNRAKFDGGEATIGDYANMAKAHCKALGIKWYQNYRDDLTVDQMDTLRVLERDSANKILMGIPLSEVIAGLVGSR